MTDEVTKKIYVAGIPCEVTAMRMGTSRQWEAFGELEGRQIRVQRCSSANVAFRDWQDKAESRLDSPG